MTEKKIRRYKQKYGAELESSGLMTGRKLKNLISASEDLQSIIIDCANQQKGGTAVKSDVLRYGTGFNK